MSIVVDSSALVAIIASEADAEALAERLDAAGDGVVSPLQMFETVMALQRIRRAPLADAITMLQEFNQRTRIKVRSIEDDDYLIALHAMGVFGKGTRHPAQLNMGDCFSYALAKRLGLALLYKGNDFKLTDIG